MAIKVLTPSQPPKETNVAPEGSQKPSKSIPKATDPGVKLVKLGSGIQNGPGLDSVDEAVAKLIARGDVTVRPDGFTASINDPDVLEDFGRLLYVGANYDQIRRILKMSRSQYFNLKKMHVERAVESLSDVGVVGMVALSFDKMEEASRQALQLAASMAGKSPSHHLAALRLVKDIESNKIDLLVRTGAIKVKKKVEISGSLDVGAGTDLEGGEKAQAVLLRINQLLVGEIEEGEIEVGEVAPPEKAVNEDPKPK